MTIQAVNQIIELAMGGIENDDISEDIVEEVIEYQTFYKPNDDLEIDQTNIVQAGKNGVLTKTYEFRTVDRVEKRYLTDTTITQ